MFVLKSVSAGKYLLGITVFLGVFLLSAQSSSLDAIKVVLVGDSTVTDASGWGLGFAKLFKPEAKVVNAAKSGRSSKSFIDEKHWKAVLEQKPDWILIQFGHNDQPGKGPARETDCKTTYLDYLAKYVDEARAIHARPILVTSLTRRVFNGEGKINSSLEDYAAAARIVAREKMVPLVDLHARSLEWHNQAGVEKSNEFNPPPDKTGKKDLTHLNAKGADLVGSLVVGELRKVAPELAKYLK